MVFVWPMLDRYLLCVAHACPYYCHNERSYVRYIYCDFRPRRTWQYELILHCINTANIYKLQEEEIPSESKEVEKIREVVLSLFKMYPKGIATSQT